MMLMRTATGFAHKARAMTFVNHYQGVVLLGQRTYFIQLGYGAIHRESAIGNDDAVTAARGFFEFGFQIGHVIVLVTLALGLA